MKGGTFGNSKAIRYHARGALYHYMSLDDLWLISGAFTTKFQMNSTHDTLGQLETPLDVADILLAFSVRRPADVVLDPSCGAGTLLDRAADWLRWLSASPRAITADILHGLEEDPDVVDMARRRVPEAQIRNRNFLSLTADDLPRFDSITGHPPDARAEYVGPLEIKRARQLAMFPAEEYPSREEENTQILHHLTATLGGRSGLHAYFLVHSTEFLHEGGQLAFVVPNGWLDAAYGVELKQYLLDHHRILAVVESAVERWFEEAWDDTCIVVLQKCANLPRRQGNLVHLVRLKQPLQQILPYSAASHHRFVAVERLVRRLLPGQSIVNDEADIQVKQQHSLRAEDKWGVALRAPLILRHHRDHLNLVPIKVWAQVHRGYTTGANDFFYLSAETIEEWGIEPRFRKPLLKSLRGIDKLEVTPEDTQSEVLLIPPDTNLQGTAVLKYIQWGEEQGIHKRRTCTGRLPWYSFSIQPAAPLAMPKGILHRHFAPLLAGDLAVDQQIYQIYLADYLPLEAIAALLNSAWFALQVEIRGRVSFGKGLLWLAAYELEEVQLPDPRQLNEEQVQRLEKAFLDLAGRPLVGSLEELARPDRQALDEVVFDLLGFSLRERSDTLRSLADRLTTRKQRAS